MCSEYAINFPGSHSHCSKQRKIVFVFILIRNAITQYALSADGWFGEHKRIIMQNALRNNKYIGSSTQKTMSVHISFTSITLFQEKCTTIWPCVSECVRFFFPSLVNVYERLFCVSGKIEPWVTKESIDKNTFLRSGIALLSFDERRLPIGKV